MLNGKEGQKNFTKAKDRELDQGSVYSFTIPVFGKGVVYDSPLEERQQQVKMLVHSMNKKSLEEMIPKMIYEAETFFDTKWGDEGEVDGGHSPLGHSPLGHSPPVSLLLCHSPCATPPGPRPLIRRLFD